MLWNAAKIRGYTIEATDGKIGTVSDLLFDDMSWSVRWLVVDTGHWLPGRKVLLPPLCLGEIDSDHAQLSVRLSMQQVKDSPDTNTDQPVSRQMETDIFEHYGWSPYWGNGYYGGGYGPMFGPPLNLIVVDGSEPLDTVNRLGDPHLRSIRETSGYHIHASDGDIGHVSDFLVGDTDWSIHFLRVETSNWWAGKTVLISPRSVRRIDWIKAEIMLRVDRNAVKNSPDYSDEILIDPSYEQGFHRYYRSADLLGQTQHPSA